MHLSGYDVAVRDVQGIYLPEDAADLVVAPGQSLRIDLHWEAVADGNREYAVSARLVDETGFLRVQHDGWPAAGSRPTSLWKEGQRIRDSHYLTIPPGVRPGPLALTVVVYDAYGGEPVSFEGDGDALVLANVTVVAGAASE